ncbi:hypothetical protein [Leptospira licerasiae]|uniref:Uncharacterized protein n=1 Tax=Leptospira licerasiae str. MMD4847 TaxID=1049971 RepID=A0ABN0HEM6_9LEPT|nr:hypothetical protein [Leptospira licerasiae]EIE01197.1 hypothetical protein LEP1GSC185_3851 [Leptospira licerasiae serovar Varillal str. VAR 010]EJZ44025.1 hypothetical protein LEP1GSC178_2039 [Leptospira licerasiae str. MMD4847]
MTTQNEEILSWLRCAEEYLEAFLTLLKCSLANNRDRCTRPTVLNFGYFLENLLKAGIIRKNNLEESEIFGHVSAKLLTEAGLTDLTKSESDIIEFLSETVKWGKYPKRGKGDSGEMLRSSSDDHLLVFADQTVFFTNLNNLKDLLKFSLRLFENIKSIVTSDLAESDEIYFSDTFDRLSFLLLTSLRSLEQGK